MSGIHVAGGQIGSTPRRGKERQTPMAKGQGNNHRFTVTFMMPLMCNGSLVRESTVEEHDIKDLHDTTQRRGNRTGNRELC